MKKSLARKFGVYSAIGLAGGMTFGTTSAEADIIFTPFNETINQGSGDDIEIDFDGDGLNEFIFDFRVVGPNGYGSNSYLAALGGVEANDLFVNTDPSPFDGQPYGPNNLAAGSLISGGLSFQNDGALQLAYSNYQTMSNFGAFNTVTPDGYVGVQFDFNGTNVFGWIGVSIDGGVSDGNAAITVNGFAFESSGGPIEAGAGIVPEPSAVGLLALGAAGLAARRRKNNKV